MKRAVLLLALVSTSAIAVPPQTSVEERLTGLTRFVDEARMKATVEKLVSFGTRHTLSSQTDPKRGIGAALDWTEAEFRKAGLETVRACDTFTGNRIPTPTKVCDILAIQRGVERPNDVVIISGHIDSRVSDPMNATADAPGANDDGSGTAATLEAGRVLSKFKFPGTIVYAVLSGEEQGLYGGKVLANYAKAQGWNVIANLNNDIIGNSCGSDGVCDDKTVRVFSEGLRWQGGDLIRADVRRLGGENDSPSRNISRFLDRLAERIPEIGLDVMQVWRNDRFGRGGDHTELLNAGYPAVRLSVAVENYDQQHQDLRTEKGVVYGDTVAAMDFPYLRKVTRLNVAALAAIASAPPPPEPTVEGAVSTDTSVSWPATFEAAHHDVKRFGTDYVIYWRRTDANQWQSRQPTNRPCAMSTTQSADGTLVIANPCKVVLPHVRVDDWAFGVSSVSADGYESPVASAVPGGAFKPVVAKPKE